jgi:hypothetical protein
MAGAKINGPSDQVTDTYREVTPPAPADREAALEAATRAAARRTLAKAPPPSQWQLALLARLCAAHPVTPDRAAQPRTGRIAS